MKLGILKLISLLVLLGGVYMLGLVLDVDYAQQAQGYVLEYWPTQEDGSLNLRMPGIAAGILLVLVGLYGFLPKLPSRKNKTITFRGVNNEITLELKPIQKMLLKIMRRMPEVYSIEVDICPDREGRRALIDAKVVLQNCAALGARQTLKMVEENIYSTASGLLGLEDCVVNMTLKGVHVDPAASGKQIREQLELRQQDATAARETSAQVAAEHTVQPPETNAQPKTATESEEDTQAEADAIEEPDDSSAEQVQATAVPDEASEDATQEVDPDEDQETDAVEEEQPATSVTEEHAEALPVVEDEQNENPDPEMSDTLHGIDLPPLAEEDVELPPGPKINQDGEITTDESADADVADVSGDDEKTPDAVEVDILSPVPWKKEEMPEPVPDELSGDPEDVDIDSEEYPNR